VLPLPSLILSSLFVHAASMNVEYPMLFNVTNRQTGRATHSGVLEFIADEGVIYMPYWVGLLSAFKLATPCCVMPWRSALPNTTGWRWMRCQHEKGGAAVECMSDTAAVPSDAQMMQNLVLQEGDVVKVGNGVGILPAAFACMHAVQDLFASQSVRRGRIAR